MSLMNISLFILAFGLWASIFLVRFKGDIREWYVNRYGPEQPPKVPETGLPDVPLPFRYKPPAPPADEAEVKND